MMPRGLPKSRAALAAAWGSMAARHQRSMASRASRPLATAISINAVGPSDADAPLRRLHRRTLASVASTTATTGPQSPPRRGAAASASSSLSSASAPGVDELLARARPRAFHPDAEFLRQASAALASAQTPVQCRAALPLCRIVERAESPAAPGGALAECVRVHEAAGHHEDAIALAERLLAPARPQFFLPNPILVSALGACAALRDAARGHALVARAVERGTLVSRQVQAALLGLAGAAGEPPTHPRTRAALAAVDEQPLPVPMFHQWMAAYARAGHWDLVDELFATMGDYGLAPEAFTYAILMDACAERGDLERTLGLFRELEARGREEGPEQGPTLVHYNVALKACGKASQLQRAFELYEAMKRAAIAPDHVTYLTMMHAVYHGELGAPVDPRAVRAVGLGAALLGLASVPLLDLDAHLWTVLFCGSLVGSMGLAVVMNPRDGALRALYPTADDPGDELNALPVVDALFRRLREEDHCGRCMYLWRDMRKHGVAADPRVVDVLVRTCIRKRHPELAFEAVLEHGAPLVDPTTGHFVLALPTIAAWLHALLVQRRGPMADAVFDAARRHRAFAASFDEDPTRHTWTYDLRGFHSTPVRSYAVGRILEGLHREAPLVHQRSTRGLPNVEFLVLHGFDLLDRLDRDDVALRQLFAMDEMTREAGGDGGGFRLRVPSARLAQFLASPRPKATTETTVTAMSMPQ